MASQMLAAQSTAGMNGPSYGEGSLSGRSQISVSIGPGNASFTSTPVPCRSIHIDSLKPHNANFDAQYAASCAMPSRPPRLDTLTTQPRPRSSHFGRRVIVMRTGDVKFTRITVSTSSLVRRGTGMRFGMAALFTRQSRPPNASHASWATRSAASRSPRSTAQSRDSGACCWHAASTVSRRSLRRATMPTVAPFSASIGASAAPIPDDAPVTRMLAPSICTAGR